MPLLFTLFTWSMQNTTNPYLYNYPFHGDDWLKGLIHARCLFDLPSSIRASGPHPGSSRAGHWCANNLLSRWHRNWSPAWRLNTVVNVESASFKSQQHEAMDENAKAWIRYAEFYHKYCWLNLGLKCMTFSLMDKEISTCLFFTLRLCCTISALGLTWRS